MTLLGLLSRVLEGSVRDRNTGSSSSASPVVRLLGDPRAIRLVHFFMLLSLVLGAVGGSQAADAAQAGENSGHYRPGALSQAGAALMIAGYAVLAGLTVTCCTVIGFRGSGAGAEDDDDEGDERRLLLAIALSLPPLLVRLVYSAASTFTGGAGGVFGVFTGSTAVLVGMSVVMEMIVVTIVEAVGLTVKKQQRKSGASGTGAGAKHVAMPSAPGGFVGSAREPLRQQDDGAHGDGTFDRDHEHGYSYGYGEEGYAMEEAPDHDRRRPLRAPRRGLGRGLGRRLF